MSDRRTLDVGVGSEEFKTTDGHVVIYVQTTSGEAGQIETVGQITVDLLESDVAITVTREDEAWFGRVNVVVV